MAEILSSSLEKKAGCFGLRPSWPVVSFNHQTWGGSVGRELRWDSNLVSGCSWLMSGHKGKYMDKMGLLCPHNPVFATYTHEMHQIIYWCSSQRLGTWLVKSWARTEMFVGVSEAHRHFTVLRKLIVYRRLSYFKVLKSNTLTHNTNCGHNTQIHFGFSLLFLGATHTLRGQWGSTAPFGPCGPTDWILPL